jgi:release factor glutamine methyltransferase
MSPPQGGIMSGHPPAPAQDQTWTIGRLLEWTTGYFTKLNLETPRLDAEVLLAFLLTCKRIDLYIMYDTEVSEGDRTRLRTMVKRRAEGCPIAYIVGKREFFSLELEVTPDVLIPRPETEILVERTLELFRDRTGLEFADIGCGSGAIGVAIAHTLPTARGVCVDISPAALQVAARNAARHGVADRLEFVKSDLFERIGEGRISDFDLIVSNPPYITEEEMAELPVSVRNYEPRLALAGGTSGLEIIERLIEQSANHLRLGGKFLMEMGATQEGSVLALLRANGRLEVMPTLRDAAGHARIVEATRVR